MANLSADVRDLIEQLSCNCSGNLNFTYEFIPITLESPEFPLKPNIFPPNEVYVFDKPYVQLIFIGLYSIVFCFCFLGNLAVVLVTTLHWRMRGTTKFCLGNLAFANLCVGIFCIYQNLSTYLLDTWMFGQFLCKMYHFITSLSHTASILILVVICVERYLAILHPFKCMRIMTKTRLRIVIIMVWVISGLMSSPRLYYITMYPNPLPLGPGKGFKQEMICAPQQNLYNNYVTDWIYFLLLFLLPLAINTILYTRVGLYLRRSAAREASRFRSPLLDSNLNMNVSSPLRTKTESSALVRNGAHMRSYKVPRLQRTSRFNHSSKSHCRRNSNLSQTDSPLSSPEILELRHFRSSPVSSKIVRNSNPAPRSSGSFCGPSDTPGSTPRGKSPAVSFRSPLISSPRQESILSRTFESRRARGSRIGRNSSSAGTLNDSFLLNLSEETRTVVRLKRQSVIRMLIVIVCTFAVCNLPFHLRKLLQNYLSEYDMSSSYSYLITPITFLLMYTNCAVNPILFAFMSQSFRSDFLDLLHCHRKRHFTK